MKFKRAGAKKKSGWKKRFAKAKSKAPFRNTFKEIHHFKRTIPSYQNIADNGLTDLNFGFEFKLSDLPNYTEFTNLFDQYRLKKVVIHVAPMFSDNAIGAIGTVSIKPYFYAIDLTDSNPPANVPALCEYGNCRTIWNPTKMRNIRVYPKSASVMYDNGITVGYSENKSNWIDCADPNIKHYGLKMSFPTNGVAGLKYILVADYYIECRHSR